jgi:hypothetical protein
MCLQPKHASSGGRINAGLGPPRGFITAPMHLAMMTTAEWYRELIAKVLGHHSKLDNEIGRQVLGLDIAPFFTPEPLEGSLIVTHNDPGVGAADEISTIHRLMGFPVIRLSRHGALPIIGQLQS